ncbi:hypothetical protein SLNWT_6723 [Streptomyces albus]|uniref:Uncharacterized protein n=1 Tax=Streptomyces albus (strain ATCC 21838 / DSM 41398 / FERM P-419 / JCM 4703 / NBRC 107858) TaxID=1081613 RepID=A0A0B5EZ70_STRA4|nr:hypothetical protein SLNWT_6723 [Streptomyces albus]AOU81404.1 hypothetical protein SLNHY_6713 [Streptomyces albus]AYN37096.1 hypothetical protein DUI70_6604 [Streptomyces albus]
MGPGGGAAALAARVQGWRGGAVGRRRWLAPAPRQWPDLAQSCPCPHFQDKIPVPRMGTRLRPGAGTRARNS